MERIENVSPHNPNIRWISYRIRRSRPFTTKENRSVWRWRMIEIAQTDFVSVFQGMLLVLPEAVDVESNEFARLMASRAMTQFLSLLPCE